LAKNWMFATAPEREFDIADHEAAHRHEHPRHSLIDAHDRAEIMDSHAETHIVASARWAGLVEKSRAALAQRANCCFRQRGCCEAERAL